MSKYQLNEESFLKDIADHEMTVLREDGVYRHIRFKRPGTVCMHFDLITWPGSLCYTGDMGTFVFARLHDMLVFFRPDAYAKEAPFKRIDRGYWAKKVEASARDGVTEFSEEKFNRAVMEHLVTWIRDHRAETTKEERRDLWEAVTSEVIGADSDSGGYRKQCAAHDFIHKVNLGQKFYFRDFWEVNVEEYTQRFAWCCYALRWAVMKYDEARALAKSSAELWTEDPDHGDALESTPAPATAAA